MEEQEKQWIGTGVWIDGIGYFKIEFLPDDNAKYKNMLLNKQYIAKKMIDQLNKIYQQARIDLDEN